MGSPTTPTRAKKKPRKKPSHAPPRRRADFPGPDVPLEVSIPRDMLVGLKKAARQERTSIRIFIIRMLASYGVDEAALADVGQWDD